MSALAGSVTLEDVFSVVEGKRVPLAPELAGYLTLEIADGTEIAGGEVDPRTVYIGEEGTVALVRPKKEAPVGDAESSVRAILVKLLDASGSSTPALTASARRAPGPGLPALVGELEAALIPVNRAAGRRALARLAREVKRVTLGVGRNASMPPPSKSPPTLRDPIPTLAGRTTTLVMRESAADVMNGPDAPPGPRGSIPSFTEEAATAKQVNQLQELAASPEAAPVIAPPPRTAGRSVGLTATVGHRVSHREESVADKLFEGDEVDSLLSTFEVSNVGEKQLRSDLKAIAGLDPTPAPPGAQAIAALTKDLAKRFTNGGRLDGDGIEALLALADSSEPPPPSRAVSRADEAQIPRVAHAQGATSMTLPFASPSAHGAFSRLAPLAPAPSAGERPSPVPLPASPPVSAEPEPARPQGGSSASQRRERPPPATSAQRRTTALDAHDKAAKNVPPRAPRTAVAMRLLALVVVAAGSIAVWMLNPAFFTGKKRFTPSTSVSLSAPVASVFRCKVALIVSDVSANAEILLRMGQAPLDVERMPMGTRLEFVATAEGYAPRRAVIKAESPWDKAPDGKARIDVPIQLDATKAKPGTVDSWPLAEPGSQVGGSGAPGTVHVVSNVRGAEIWLLAGLGPEARIEQLRCDGEIEVLLAGPPQLRKRLHVSEKDVQSALSDAQGNRVVAVSAK